MTKKGFSRGFEGERVARKQETTGGAGDGCRLLVARERSNDHGRTPRQNEGN
jgi:hypothetical protein